MTDESLVPESPLTDDGIKFALGVLPLFLAVLAMVFLAFPGLGVFLVYCLGLVLARDSVVVLCRQAKEAQTAPSEESL